MLTRNEVARLEAALRGTRVLSVYVNAGTRDPAERTAWRRELERQLAHARTVIGDASHEEREAFEACAARMYERLAELPGASGMPGWAGFFPASGTPYAEALPVELPTLIVWDEGVHVAPYIRALKQHSPALVAIVDARSAVLYVYAHDTLEAVETLHAAPHSHAAEHMGYPPRLGFHTGTHGTVGADQNERDRRASAEGLVRELVQRLEVLAGSRAWVLVGGIPELSSAVMRALPERFANRSQRLPHLDVHATEAEIREAAERVATAASRERDLVRVLELLDHRLADGKGVSGRRGTRHALVAHAVGSLFFTGNFVAQQPDEAEALLRLAFDQGAEVEHVSGAAADELDHVGGVGALLRFVPGSVPDTAQQTMAGGAT